MIPKGITAEHIRLALRDLDEGQVSHRFADSTGYDLLYNGRRYPPKAALGLAARHLPGRSTPLTPDDFSGGEDSSCFRVLRKLGFEIVPKLGKGDSSTFIPADADDEREHRLEARMETIELHVYRDLSNRIAGEPDDGPMAREAHRRRAAALHEDLRDFNVVQWGATDDETPHELVSLVIALLAVPAVKAAVVPALAFVGVLLAETVKSTMVDGVKYVVAALVKRMRDPKKAVQDFNLAVPDGSQVWVDVDATIHVTLSSGKHISIRYEATEAEVKAQASLGASN